MARKRELVVSTVLILIFGVPLVYSLANNYWERLPYASYKMGEEIRGFPIDGLSITVVNLSTSPDITFHNSSEDVILHVIIQNLASYPIDFSQPELQLKLYQAANKHFYLAYTLERGGGGSAGQRIYNKSDWWGITFSKNEFKGLATNESLNGSILFVLGDDAYTSFQLACIQASQQKPLFIVNLERG